jgi:hypothetical protein
MIMIPETYRAVVRKINPVTCASCWDFYVRIWTNNFGTYYLATFTEQMKHWKESNRYNWLVLYNFRVSAYMLHPCEERIFRITTTYEWSLTLCNRVHVARLFSEACHSASASPANLRAYATTPRVAACLFPLSVLSSGQQIGFSEGFLIFMPL